MFDFLQSFFDNRQSLRKSTEAQIRVLNRKYAERRRAILDASTMSLPAQQVALNVIDTWYMDEFEKLMRGP